MLALLYCLLFAPMTSLSANAKVNEAEADSSLEGNELTAGGSEEIVGWMSNKSLQRSFLKYYLPFNFTNGSGCEEAIEDLPSNEGYTLRMVDSWGKTADGILWGNYRPLGMFEQCIQLVNKNSTMKGRYCIVVVKFQREEGSYAEPRLVSFFAKIPNQEVPYKYGTCIPDACSQQELKQSLKVVYEENGDKLQEVTCYTSDDQIKFTGGDISFIVFLSIIGLLMLTATLADILTMNPYAMDRRKGWMRFLLAFSVYTNLKKLFTLNMSPPKSSINCLHGMRVLSMIWVIYGHQYIFTITNTLNILDIKRQTTGFLFQIFANATFSVDSFFFISGLLVAYLTFQSLDKTNGKMNLPMYYLHRYIRLTPAIAMTAWFQATIARFFVRGPNASEFEMAVTENCRNRWWTDVLYVNNFLSNATEQGKKDCIGQAWYTAVDTQIYLFTPVILLPLFHFHLFGKLWFCFWTIASGIVPAIITVCLNLPPFYKMDRDPKEAQQMWYYLYAAPFSRAGPYFIGMWTGYLLFLLKDKPLRLQKRRVICGWFVNTCTALSLLFGIYRYNVLGGPTDWNVAEQFFYGGFSRLVWAIPLAWIVVMCHKGYGGPVNWVLSHPGFQPLSRLTYSMFLTSIGIQMMIGDSNKTFYYFSHTNKLIETCGALFIIAIAAIVLSLVIESPLITIEKELKTKHRTHPNKEGKSEQNSSIGNLAPPSSNLQIGTNHFNSEFRMERLPRLEIVKHFTPTGSSSDIQRPNDSD